MRILARDIGGYEGKEMELAGWVAARRDHGKLIFIDLRDRSGVAQIVFAGDAYEDGNKLRSEWVIRAHGTVGKRPKGMENPELPNGGYEVKVLRIDVLAEADTPPISVEGDGRDIGEDKRMQYRYLDLRRERMARNIRQRACVISHLRRFFEARGFVEVETPDLGKSTPEGARDYLVPSRVHPGMFYALPQSPQQYKQLLMVAGLERYFQIVRCFRDEDTRGDRQPEFTQVDVELSFTDEEEIMSLTEAVFLSLVRDLYPEKKLTLGPDGRIPRMTYAEAMERYQSDKPDVRSDRNDPNELAFLFVVDFPAFEWSEEHRRWQAVHHPFTMPKVKDADELRERFAKNPEAIVARQYDVVLNGYEIGGGSIRIHEQSLLRAVFELLGHRPEEIQEQFGHLLEAFRYGVPPHGGVAYGIDRAIMILQNEPSIREVIAFPKTGDGRDLLMHAPSPVDEGQLKALHLKIDTP